MRKLFLSLFTFLFIFSNVYSQGTYFQQKVDTYIEVRLDDVEHALSGYEKIKYTNNSPYKLDSMIFHIWPNAYKNVNTQMARHNIENGDIKMRFAKKEQRGYIKYLDFQSNGKKLEWHYYNSNIDIIVVHLHDTILPGESIEISTPFHVKIPDGIFSRLGHIGQSYQITQWFPKPAVFDQNGWHPLPYLSQGEFYSEFGSYDVKITVPENYVVGATGDLVDGESELKFLNEKVKQTEYLFESDQLPQKDSLGKINMIFPKSSANFKTLHFHQENIHDFAWFADKRYHVLKGEIELPESGRKVTTWAMFTNNEADLWKNAIEYINDATYFYSSTVGEYPYDHVTAVDGSISAGGGMEYPNITVIGESGSAFAHEQVIVHEVGHNWFYGILGNNERENAWMDEGMNTFAETRHMQIKHPNGLYNINRGTLKKLGLEDLNHSSLLELGYLFNARRNLDQPIQMGASLYTGMNYGTIVYGKTGLGFEYLKSYLGEDLFDRCMKAYFSKWKFKHPSPEDIRQVFESESNQNLSWFFEDFIQTSNKIDYKISKIKKRSNEKDTKQKGYELTLKNRSQMNTPISVTGLNSADSNLVTYSKWIPGFINDTTIFISSNQKTSHFVLNYNKKSTDINSSNNVIRTSGILKKAEPIKLSLLAGIDQHNKTKIYWTPILGWNAYDKLMPGLAFYNTLIFEKKFEWLFAPMFSIGNKALNGTAKINYRFYPNKIASKITLGYKGSSYYQGFDYGEANQRWAKNEIRTDIRFKEKSIRSSPLHKLSVKGIRIDEHHLTGSFIEPPETEHKSSYFGVIDYTLKNKQFLTPKSLAIRYVYGVNSKTSEQLVSSISLTGNYRVNYNKKMDGIELRIFGGYNLFSSGSRYNFFLRGQDGQCDFLYERTYLGRNKIFPNALAQQTSTTHGNFHINTPIGSSDTWLISSNIKIEIPKSPLGIYTDFGIYPSIVYTPSGLENKINYLFNSGLYFSIKANKKEILGIYAPLWYSDKIGSSYIFGQSNTTMDVSSFLQRITFILNIENINPFKIIKSIAP